MTYTHSKRFIIFSLLFFLISSSIFASNIFNGSLSVDFGFGTYNENKSTRITFPIVSARGIFDIIDKYNASETKTHISLGFSAGLGLTIAETGVPSEVKNHVHPDLFFSFLPGVTFDLNENFHITIAAGVKYMRLGYRKIDSENSLGTWDTILSFVLLGSRPLRIFAVSLDAGIRIGEIGSFTIGTGINASIPVLQMGNTEHFNETFTLEPYITLSL